MLKLSSNVLILPASQMHKCSDFTREHEVSVKILKFNKLHMAEASSTLFQTRNRVLNAVV